MAETTNNEPDKFPENRTTGVTEMSLALEMQNGIKALGADRKCGGNRESMIADAARLAGISFRQAKTFFYAESENPRGKAIEAVRAAMAKKQKAKAEAERAAEARREQEKAAFHELTELRQRIARLEQLVDARAANRRRASSALAGQENSNRG